MSLNRLPDLLDHMKDTAQQACSYAAGLSKDDTRIVEACYVNGHTIWLRFGDDTEGEVNLESELEGEVFEPLKGKTYFKNFTLHTELRTVVWPNGADFAPEFLWAAAHIAA